MGSGPGHPSGGSSCGGPGVKMKSLEDWKMIILCIGNCEIELTPMYILKTDQSSSPCTLAAGSKMARSEASLAPMTTIESPGDFPREVDLRRKAFRERSVQKN